MAKSFSDLHYLKTIKIKVPFSDLAQILESHPDANIAYNQLVRPWKSRLSLLCIEHSSLQLDIKLLILTFVAIVDRRAALNSISKILTKWGTDETLQRIALREEPLIAYPPPGANRIVEHR